MNWTEETIDQAVVNTDMLAEVVRKSLCRAIKVANQAAGVPNQTFWDNLFIDKQYHPYPSVPEKPPTEKPPLMSLTKKGSIPLCPEDPYDHLDLQLCLKYLYYGPNRAVLVQGKYRHLEESLHFYKYFGISTKWNSPYKEALMNLITYRNQDKSHRSNAYDRAVTPEKILESISSMEAVLKPLFSRKGWEGNKTPMRTYWTERLEKMYQAVGALPIRLRTLTDNLCAGGIFPREEVTKQAGALLKLSDIPVKDGYVYLYNTTPARLEQGLLQFISAGKGAPDTRDVQHLRACLGLADAAAAPSAPGQMAPMPASLARLLRRYPRQLPATEEVLEALLKGFTLLVDTQVFLTQEGGALLRNLVPVLRKTGQKLPVDAGVIHDLMRRYRENSPQTSAPALSQEDRELSRQLYDQAHLALKTLRFLREHDCLQVIAPNGAEPLEGFTQLIRQYPGKRFFVFAETPAQAQQLQDASSGNAVSAKICLDGTLLIYGSAKAAWQALLEQEQAQPAQADAPTERPSRVTAVAADGSRQILCLEKKLGEGGEGTVYLTDNGMVAKLYHGPQLTDQRREKLSYMLESDPQIPGVCWPQALLFSQEDSFLGYVMPKAAGDTLDSAVFHPGMDFLQIRRRGWQRQHLALICGNIATVFARLHSKQILMGDVNPQNIMVDESCNVYFVDCDSYQFSHFECPVGKPDYTPPEIHKLMREQGVTTYRYRRTEENERYSMAVLLFSVLMMGKPPYAARNAGFDDVVDAVIAGHFPYPYKTDDTQAPARSAIMAPAGVWRNIWSHMTYQLKTCFYNTFAQQGTGRLSAQQWAQAMQEYIQAIRLGRSTDEIAPHGYKDTSHEDGTGTKMVELVCAFCNQPYNIAEDVYQRRKGTPEENLCGVHYEMMRNFRNRTKKCTCDQCGTPTEISVYHWMRRTDSGKPILCDTCEYETVVCAQCGKTHRRSREKVNALRREGKQLICKDCLTRQKGS